MEIERERESQADFVPSEEPDAGLSSTMQRSQPEPKASGRLNRLCHPAAPHLSLIWSLLDIITRCQVESEEPQNLRSCPKLG